jgi:hypothetical protein
MLAQGGYPQPGAMPAGYPPYPYPMMAGYPAPPATGKRGKAAAAGEPAVKGRKRRKRIPQGGPKKPATSFVLFSNTVREEVKEQNPGENPAFSLLLPGFNPLDHFSSRSVVAAASRFIPASSPPHLIPFLTLNDPGSTRVRLSLLRLSVALLLCRVFAPLRCFC